MKTSSPRTAVPDPGSDYPRTTLVRSFPRTYELDVLSPWSARSITPSAAAGSTGALFTYGAPTMKTPQLGSRAYDRTAYYPDPASFLRP